MELNDRQTALLAQVVAGKVTEQQPDTDEQLLTLSRLGLIRATSTGAAWRFEPLEQAKPKRTRRKAG